MILYPDTVAAVITRLSTLTRARPEAYMAGVAVHSDATDGKCVTVTTVGGYTTNRFLTATHAVDVYAPDPGDAADITRMILALYLQHGPDGVCDGKPVTDANLNSGPTEIQSTTEQTRYRMVIPTTVRGETI